MSSLVRWPASKIVSTLSQAFRAVTSTPLCPSGMDGRRRSHGGDRIANARWSYLLLCHLCIFATYAKASMSFTGFQKALRPVDKILNSQSSDDQSFLVWHDHEPIWNSKQFSMPGYAGVYRQVHKDSASKKNNS